MPTECQITFPNSPEKVFYGGQTLVGRVDLSLTNPKSVRGIYVEISGSAYCQWTEGSGDKKRTYTGNECYLNERMYLRGGPNYGEITLQPGQYSYIFSCSLPLGLPTSLEGEIGHIRYMAKVVLDCSEGPDEEYEELFTVIKPLNLNLEPSWRLPVIKHKFKTCYPCCLFFICISDPMHLIARIPVKGYTPGQTINVQILVYNKCETDAVFSVQLMKHITYHTSTDSSKQRMETVLVCKKGRFGCSSVNSFELYRPSLLIPPIPPTDVDGSNICKVRYILRILGNIYGCYDDTRIDVPIIIGTYPILDGPTTAIADSGETIVQQPTAEFNWPSAPSEFPQPSVPLLPQNGVSSAPPYPIPLPADASAPPPYPEDDPPTYEQATAMSGNAVDSNSFRPSYPVYRRTTSYSRDTNE